MCRDCVKCVVIALAVMCGGQSAPAAAQEPDAAGLVVSVTGDVLVHRGAEPQKAEIGFVLYEGDTLVVMQGATCTGFTPAGTTFELEGPAELQLALPPQRGPLDTISGWIRSQLAQWAGARRRWAPTTRAAPDWGIQVPCPIPLVPVADGQIRPSRPRFLWTLIPGIERYEVTLVPVQGEQLTRTVSSHGITVDDLLPGGQYAWSVRPAIKDWEGEREWRSFRVLTPEEEKQLDLALGTLKDVEAGVHLLSVGLHQEAIRRFDAVVSSGRKVHSARVWRARAFAEVGLFDEAYKDLLLLRESE